MKLLATIVIYLMAPSVIGNPLIGTWQSDEEKTLLEVKKVQDMSQKSKELFENNFFGKLILRFTESKVYSQYEGDETEEPYEVVKETYESITIKTWNGLLNENFEHTYYIDGESIYSITSKYNFREYFRRIK